MSLGRHRGAALIGRPLDISVQATLDAPADPAAQCIEADAFYADNKLDKSMVRVSTERVQSNPLETVIRIRSSVPVDEPVVILYVRLGCQQKAERRYVVLADLVSEPASQPTLPSVPSPAAPNASPVLSFDAAADPVPVRRKSARPITALAGGPGGVSDPLTPRPTSAVTDPRDMTSTAKRDRQRVSDIAASGKNTEEKARLKLEPLDLSAERDPQLRPSKELLSVPSDGESRRSAAGALWRALTLQPQDILRDSEKIQSLENSLSALRAQTQKNQLELNELKSQLEKTRSERYANWLVYVMGTLLLLAFIGLIYIWRLRTSSGTANTNELPWWRKNKPSEKGWANNFRESVFPSADNSATAEDTDSSGIKRKGKKNNKPGRALPNPNLDSALGTDESAFTEVRHISSLDSDSLLLPLSSLDFTVSMPLVARSIKAEELFDVQQQADFFVSLGQYDQAVDVLRGHIVGNTQTSPLVYLDLFNLYHQLDRQVDYDALREDFNQLFTGKIPAFELYTDSSPGLDAYPLALTRIEALWPSPKVLEVIEESILRRPVANADAFDLEAYRELLLLYAVAKELVHPEGGKNPSSWRPDLPAPPADDRSNKAPKFSPTSILPLSAMVEERGIKDIEPISPLQWSRLALDMDLSDSAATAAAETPRGAVGMPSNSNSNLFARPVIKAPFSSSVASPASSAPQLPSPEVDNMIDFDAFDPFVKNSDQAGHPPEPVR